MRKIIAILYLVTVLLLGGCSSNVKPMLKGAYQSDKQQIGYAVLLSFQQDDKSFVEYIDNREVDRGIYEKKENNVYKIKSDKQSSEIVLNNDNSFEIIIKKLNNGKAIQMQNVGDPPTYFSTKFNDVDEYKALLD